MDLTTPRLLLQYQEAVLGNELGYVSRRQLRAVTKRLREEQGRLNRRAEAVRAKREAVREAERQRQLAEAMRQAQVREAERRVRRREQALIRRDRRRINVILTRTIGEDIFNDIIEIWKAVDRFGVLECIVRGTRPDESQIVGYQDPANDYGPIYRQVPYEVKFEIFHTRQSKQFVRQFFVGNTTDGTFKIDTGDRVMVVAPTTLNAQRLNQLFRDGGVDFHCVFDNINKTLLEKHNETQSKDRKQRLKQRINKLQTMRDEFEKGVPENMMEEVAKVSGFKITIKHKLQRTLGVFNENGKQGHLIFTNTRPNHLEMGYCVLDGKPTYVSQEQINTIWKKCMKENKDYNIEGDLKNGLPRKLLTFDEVYEVYDPNKEYYDVMNEIAQVNKCRFNATKHPEVNEFIKAGRIINAWVTPFSDEKPTGYIDMPKAYTQFKKCSHYAGFLGVVHQWRTGTFDKKWLEEHIGIYQVRMKTSNPLFNKLGISKTGMFGKQETTHILPSPEILYFMDNGVECSVVAGVWGSRTDFDFPQDMLEDKRYAKWSGRLSMEHTSKKYSFHCDKEWASHLKADYGDDCYYWEDRKLCSIKLPIEQVFTTHHILAFITSYVRIQMMEAMKQFKLEQIVKVVLDGIFFKGDMPECLGWFREKEITQHSYKGFAWYDDEIMNVNWDKVWISENTLLTGQGGAGKTYKVLTDKCFNRILFVTPQHILGGDVSEKYSVPYTTIHKLIGEGCEPYIASHSYPPVIFIDEVTQIASDWIDRVFKLYTDSLIIIAGDLNERQWFQCRNGHPGDFSVVWKPVGVDVLEVAGDRRSRDDKLRKLKLDIRDEMKRVFIDGDTSEVTRMKMWSYKNLPPTKFQDAVAKFAAGDVWIAGTHATSKKLLDAGVCSGWYKQGGFVSFEEKEGYTKRGSFTTHSFQGRTLETGKIFVSLNDTFEYAMLYTAISRAVSYDQLVFVV
jgi:hypothetical protein